MRKSEALFPKLDPYMVGCLQNVGRIREYADGEALFLEDEKSDTFHVVLEGQVRVTKHVGSGDMLLATHDPMEFTGDLSVLAEGLNNGTGRAVGPTKTLHVTRDCFGEAISACPAMLARIVPALAQRRPEAMNLTQQREKLVALGTLSAGLAHELNNPASAAKRASDQLRAALGDLRKNEVTLCELDLPIDRLRALQDTFDQYAGKRDDDLDPLERSDRETAIGDHLEEIGVEDPWDVSASLVDAGLLCDDVKKMARDLPCQTVAGALSWLASSLTVDALVREIGDSATRVSELVESIKRYSHMDRAAEGDFDVVEGIKSTFIMLKHKVKRKSLTVEKEIAEGLPPVSGNAGEMNQVWTNLLDNAIDAAPEGGVLRLRVHCESGFVRVDIEDNGGGIPLEARSRIFEPFFTTKPMGQGTGMGLDIAYRIVNEGHNGTLTYESEPGKTVFTVCLPVAE
ncbi:cyclic nucleotide-binding domain-containing protein [bacterium]|nr:MAG: cyclic nucleotide-binding domain-containing protein [bacterium]